MAKASKTTTSVALVSESESGLKSMTYEQLLERLPMVIAEEKDKLKSLKGDEKDDAISLDIEYGGTTISSVDKVGELIEIKASIRARAAAYSAILEEENLVDRVTEWQHSNKPLHHWEKVLSKALKALLNKAEIEQIEKRIKIYEERLPEQQKMFNSLLEVFENSNQKLK
jgi:hypothetical protein